MRKYFTFHQKLIKYIIKYSFSINYNFMANFSTKISRIALPKYQIKKTHDLKMVSNVFKLFYDSMYDMIVIYKKITYHRKTNTFFYFLTN